MPITADMKNWGTASVINMHTIIRIISSNNNFFLMSSKTDDCGMHRKILKKMARFKELCPEHADKEVLAGVAAVNFEEGAYELARESGLIIIHVKEESVFELEPEFTLDPVPDKCVLRRF